MKLYYNPVSSYSQKALMAFHEKGVAYTPHVLDFGNAEARAEYRRIFPMGKVPGLVTDDGTRIWEATILVEYLEDTFPTSGTRLIPADRDLARKTRFHDRNFDLYVNDPVSTIFFDGRKPEAERNPAAVAAAKARLDAFYAAANQLFAKHTWATGDTFSMADCAAAPSLGYARMVYGFDAHPNLVAYANRLAERPSFQKVMAEAMPILRQMM